MNDTKAPLSIVSVAPAIALSNIENARDLVGEVELAARLGVSRSTLQSWRYSRRGPRYVKIGRLVRYRNVDVEAFLAASTRNTRAA